MIVLDSSFLVAFHNRRDIHHAAASNVMQRLLAGEWGQALLLEYVFVEVVTVLAARRSLAVASHVATVLLEAKEIDFVPCSDFFAESLEAFQHQPRGALSFTDAAIVTVARRDGVGRVATFDADFRDVEAISVVPA